MKLLGTLLFQLCVSHIQVVPAGERERERERVEDAVGNKGESVVTKELKHS